MNGKSILISAALGFLVPLLSARAQDVDVQGNLTMVDSSAAAGNILKQGFPFIHNFGTNNTFVGSGSGNFLMSGTGNTGNGTNALLANTTGSFCTAVGENALLSNSAGNENTAVGDSALYSNTTGSKNTAVGSGALYNNTTGGTNTAIGWGAMQFNTTGLDNVAIGSQAMQSNTTGRENTANGLGALLSNTTGSSNTATGFLALSGNTTGTGNTANGRLALAFNTTGSSNTAIGIGTLVQNLTGEGNTALGSLALNSSFFGNHNTAVGVQALQGNAGNNNTAVGFNSGVSPLDVSNATAIGAGAIVNASNKIRLGNTSITRIEGQVGFTASSDRTKKENFRPVDGEEVLGKIRGLEITSWNFIGQDPAEFRHYGPMAQDFFHAFGHDAVGTIGTPTTITTTDIDGILVVAAKALEKRTLKQERRMSALRAENADLKARLEALERRLDRDPHRLTARTNP